MSAPDMNTFLWINLEKERNMEELMTMNTKERERLKVMVRLAEGTLTHRVAATQLNIGERQLRRLFSAYQKLGDVALVSKQRGKQSNNHLTGTLKGQILELIRTHYSDCGPTYIQEKLMLVHHLKVSVSAMRILMIEHKIWNSNERKAKKIHQRRLRRACLGELIQMDGSYHDWFEGRAPTCCLLVLIDDATGRLMGLKFVEWESTFGYFDMLKQYLKTHGLPLALYTDRLAVFETTRKTEKEYQDTQFHRAMKSLGIGLILAYSPQAKGRVERVNRTLQDRLIKEMRLAGISSIAEANAFLPGFIDMYNKKFARVPRSSVNAHKSLEPEYNLEQILCLQHKRSISKDLMVNWKRNCYQITTPHHRFRLGGKEVLVLEYETGSFELLYEKELLRFVNFKDQPKALESIGSGPELLKNWKKPRGGKPSSDHPWKQWKAG